MGENTKRLEEISAYGIEKRLANGIWGDCQMENESTGCKKVDEWVVNRIKDW